MENLANLADVNAVSIETWMFYVLAAIAIPFAYGVILDRAIIRSGFLLIGVFGAISGLFLILQAQFIAMAQIMIYAVGITLVVVIALMLTNPRMNLDLKPANGNSKVWGFAFSFLLFAVIYMAIRSEYWPVKGEIPSGANVAVIGAALTGQYSLPFEFASVLLLAALMGAVMLAKNEPSEPETLEYSENIGTNEAETPEAVTSSR
ncbi:MAG TPA: NADH-quinone oxidoreductase subunit J [Drouetiella sp.]